jgi:hypothetical protein
MEEPAVPVGPFHHRGDGETVGLMSLHFIAALRGNSFLRHTAMVFALV